MQESSSIDTKMERLRAILRELAPIAVAYSGGVDSSLLAVLAHQELGDRALAITAVSPSLARADLKEARLIADAFGFRHELVQTNEFDDVSYLENSPQRCYWCKREILRALGERVKAGGGGTLIDGSNLDDLGDHRPGRQAAAEYGLCSPFVEAGIGKTDVRAFARALGLPNWDKPAAACLSSRIPFGTPIDAGLLERIQKGEEYLHELGIRQARLRHHGDIARLEVSPADFTAVLAQSEGILKRLQALGYTFVALDLAGYQTGSLNKLIKEKHES